MYKYKNLQADQLPQEFIIRKYLKQKADEDLKLVSATFLLVYFVCLREGTSRKNVFYFTLKSLFVLEIIRF